MNTPAEVPAPAAPVRLGVEPAEARRRRLCIELLEKMLMEAKEGRGFESVFFIATHPDSDRLRTAWPEGTLLLDVLGRIEFLKHQLLADGHERREDG